MENIYKSWAFLISDPIGLVILSIISSIIGTLLYECTKRSIKIGVKKYKKGRFIKHLTIIATSFIHGKRAVYVQYGTTAQQTFWAADYIISIVKHIGYILGLLLVLCILLIILPLSLYWFPVIIVSIMLSIRIKILKRHLFYFDKTVEMMFGENYLEREQDSYIKYWDSLCKKKKDNNETDASTTE